MAVILNWIDVCALVFYFLLVIGFGIWVNDKIAKKKEKYLFKK